MVRDVCRVLGAGQRAMGEKCLKKTMKIVSNMVMFTVVHTIVKSHKVAHFRYLMFYVNYTS